LDSPASECEPRNGALRANQWVHILRIVGLRESRTDKEEEKVW
jgi:hypothetical protein